MIKFESFAAFAVSAFVALPVCAADLHVANTTASVVRITVANKPLEQLNKEILAAANLVCADAGASSRCVEDAVEDANRQVRDLTKRQAPSKIEVARDDPTSVRISLAGKSLAQVNQEIEAAAATVCKGATGSEYRECVSDSVQDAKGRLSETQRAGRLAMN